MAKGQAIVRLTAETNDYERKMRQADKTFNDFLKGIGLSVGKFSALSAAIGATTTAMKVAKDAFNASEAAVDEWGRIVDSSKSLYEGFLNSINNGDISGFLGRIDEIVQAARKAYDELDRLGTMKTIQSPKISAQMTENERLRMMIRTRRYIAPQDGRRATMANGTLLSDAQIRVLERQLANGMKNVTTLVGNEINQTSRAINAVYERQAKELGMSLNEFKRGTSSMAEFEKRVRGGEMYERWQQEHSVVDQQSGRLIAPTSGNPYKQYRGWNNFRVDGERYNKLVQLILQRDQQMGQSYSMQSQAYTTINRAEGITSRIGGRGGGGRGGSGGGGGSTSADVVVSEIVPIDSVRTLKKEMAELQKEQELVTNPASWESYQSIINGIAIRIKEIKGELTSSPVSISSMLELPEEAEALKKGEERLKNFKLPKTGKEMEESWGDAAQAIASASNAMASMDMPEFNIIGAISQAIANIALGFSQASAADSKLGVVGWIVSIASGLATMISTIAAIKSATAGSYADGGLIPGNNYNDGLVANVSSGELILNRSQQGNLAAQLAGSRYGGGNSQPYVDGEKIWLGLSHYLSRRGMGEIVTSRRG